MSYKGDIPSSKLSDLAVSNNTGARSNFVYRALLDAIRAGQIKPGDRLREEEIADWLEVSRTPVRQALQHLLARRLVERTNGRGIVVIELNTHQIIDLYAMREVLEGAAARLAAQHALPAEIAMMNECLDMFDEAAGDSARLAQINAKLHKLIYEAARNSYMLEALTNLGDSLSLLQNTTYSVPERHASASAEHRAIVAAIESRDSDVAETTSRAHIRASQRVRMRMEMDQ